MAAGEEWGGYIPSESEPEKNEAVLEDQEKKAGLALLWLFFIKEFKRIFKELEKLLTFSKKSERKQQ